MEYIFETEHLGARAFRGTDAAQLYINHRDENVKRFIPNEVYADLDEAKGAAAFFAECVNGGRLPYVLAVVLKDNGELIGDVGINEIEGHSGEVEIGYSISDRYAGRGYATELVTEMTAFAFETFKMGSLFARVLHGNHASVRVLEKNGYTFIGEDFDAEDDPYGNGMLIFKKDN